MHNASDMPAVGSGVIQGVNNTRPDMTTPVLPADDTYGCEEWNHNVETTLDAVGDFVVNNLDVNQLLMFIQLDEVNKIIRQLHHLCSEGKPDAAARELLAAIKRSPEPGKWRMFVQALMDVSGKDSIILHYLQRGSTDPWLDSPVHRKVIDLFREPIHESFNIENLMPKMIEVGLISRHHEKQILARLRNGQTVYAQVELITAMQSHKTNWYRKFVTILYEDENTRDLAERIDPDFCKEKLEEAMKARKEAEEEAMKARKKAEEEESSRQKQDRQDNAPPHGSTGSKAGSVSVDSSRKGAGNERCDPSHDQIKGTPDPHQKDASCGCRCCGQLQRQVTSLNTTVLHLRSDLQEIKQILAELVQKVGN